LAVLIDDTKLFVTNLMWRKGSFEGAYPVCTCATRLNLGGCCDCNDRI